MFIFALSPLLLLIPGSSSLLSKNYESLTANEKLDILWDNIRQTTYSDAALPKSNPSIFSSMGLLLPNFLKKSFTNTADEMPGTRQKLIHTHGSVAKVEFRVTENTSFTGIFRSGGVGLARLSLARWSESYFIPGMALKVMVDGQPSVNFHVMNSLEGQGQNRNFFEHRFKNILPEPSSIAFKVGAQVFNLARWLLPGGRENRPENERNMPLYEHAAVDSTGNPVPKVHAPYVVIFTPNPELSWSPNNKDDLRINLSRIPVGTVLYTVALQRGLRTEEEVIGQLVTTSPFVASRYGDEILFFQHSRKRWMP